MIFHFLFKSPLVCVFIIRIADKPDIGKPTHTQLNFEIKIDGEWHIRCVRAIDVIYWGYTAWWTHIFTFPKRNFTFFRFPQSSFWLLRKQFQIWQQQQQQLRPSSVFLHGAVISSQEIPRGTQSSDNKSVSSASTQLIWVFFPEMFSDLPIIRKVHNKTKEQRGERIIFRGWLLYPLLHSITGWSKSLTLKWLTTKNVFLVSNGNRPPQLHSTTQWIDFYWEKLFRSLRPKALLSLLNNSPCALKKWYCKNWKLFSPFRCAFDGVIFLRLK